MTEDSADRDVLPGEAVAQELDADVILYNGRIERPEDLRLIDLLSSRRRRPNVLLLLVTEGGDADAAYRIARALQGSYKRFTMYVSGLCKSAGTIVATGAHELVISDHGELGPLDVQMAKKDELWERQSGLTPMATLTTLQTRAFETFSDFFLKTKARSGDTITVKTASQIATELTVGLFAPLYGQLNPLDLGEASRAMLIASRYCTRLIEGGKNFNKEALVHLAQHYPSHSFVIDRDEAEEFFESVREPTETEVALASKLGWWAREPAPAPILDFLSSEPGDDDDEGQIRSPSPADTEPPATEASGESAPDAEQGVRKGDDQDGAGDAEEEPESDASDVGN